MSTRLNGTSAHFRFSRSSLYVVYDYTILRIAYRRIGISVTDLLAAHNITAQRLSAHDGRQGAGEFQSPWLSGVARLVKVS
jgi:hypothetical protein